jgi:hypothetical protein
MFREKNLILKISRMSEKSERRREIEALFNAQHPDPPGAEVTVAVESAK